MNKRAQKAKGACGQYILAFLETHWGSKPGQSSPDE